VNENWGLEITCASIHPLSFDTSIAKNFIDRIGPTLSKSPAEIRDMTRHFIPFDNLSGIPPLDDNLLIYEFTDLQSKSLISKMYYGVGRS
jgi:hypothetical protein